MWLARAGALPSRAFQLVAHAVLSSRDGAQLLEIGLSAGSAPLRATVPPPTVLERLRRGSPRGAQGLEVWSPVTTMGKTPTVRPKSNNWVTSGCGARQPGAAPVPLGPRPASRAGPPPRPSRAPRPCRWCRSRSAPEPPSVRSPTLWRDCRAPRHARGRSPPQNASAAASVSCGDVSQPRLELWALTSPCARRRSSSTASSSTRRPRTSMNGVAPKQGGRRWPAPAAPSDRSVDHCASMATCALAPVRSRRASRLSPHPNATEHKCSSTKAREHYPRALFGSARLLTPQKH